MLNLLKSKPINIYHYLKFIMSIFFLLSIQCGIEVGNPHTDEDEEAILTVEITDAPIDGLQHVYLKFKSISLYTENKTLYDLDANLSGEIDILSLQDGETSILVNEQSLAPLNFLGFYITLDEGSPGYVVTKEGDSRKLKIGDKGGKNAILVEERINLSSSASIVLHLDLRHSIKIDSGGQYFLDPVITPVKRREAASISGNLVNITSGFVCAYLESNSFASLSDTQTPDKTAYKANDTMQKPRKHRPLPDSEVRHPSKPAPTGGRPPKPLDGATPEICGGAFTGIPIKSNGDFTFHFLKPGRYDLWVHSNENHYQLESSIEVSSGEHKALDPKSL